MTENRALELSDTFNESDQTELKEITLESFRAFWLFTQHHRQQGLPVEKLTVGSMVIRVVRTVRAQPDGLATTKEVADQTFGVSQGKYRDLECVQAYIGELVGQDKLKRTSHNKYEAPKLPSVEKKKRHGRPYRSPSRRGKHHRA